MSSILQAVIFLVLFMSIMENIGQFCLTKAQIFAGLIAILVLPVLIIHIYNNEAIANILLTISIIIFYSLATRKLLFCIAATMLSIIIVFFSEQIGIFIFTLITGDAPDRNSPVQLTIENTFLIIIAFSISYLIGKGVNKLEINKINFANNMYSKLTILGLVSVFALYYFQIFVFPDIADKNLNALISIIIGIYQLVIVFTAVFIFFNSEKKTKEAEHNLELLSNLEIYISNIEKMYNTMRSFRHDYTNVILSLYGYIEDQNYNGLSEYIKGNLLPIISDMERSNYTLDRLKNLHIPQLKGLIAMQLLNAEDKGITVNLEIPDVIEFIHMNLVDLTRVVGILLDNAIEASSETSDPVVNLLIYQNKGDMSIVYIMFSNSFKNTAVPISTMFEKGYSSKGGNRGLGLHNVSQIKKKYPNIILNTYIENNEFIQQLCIGESSIGES